jgi:hypothetical protein
MLITDRFVALQVPKTGGQWLAEVLAPFVVERRPEHGEWREIPAEYAALPQLAIVRNPWDWYVSWWHWWQRNPSGAPPDAVLPFDEALGAMREVNAEMRQHGRYGVWFRRVVGPRTELIRFERLREGLLEFLRLHDTLDAELEHRVLSTPSRNVSERGHYSEYYDDASRRLVEDVSASIVDRFGYRFSRSSAAAQRSTSFSTSGVYFSSARSTTSRAAGGTQ